MDTKELMELYQKRATELTQELARGHMTREKLTTDLKNLDDQMRRIEGARLMVSELAQAVQQAEAAQKSKKTPKAEPVTA